VTASTIDAIEAAVGQAGLSAGDVGAIGLGIPGQVEPESGVVRTANNLAIDGAGYPIAIEISARFGVPTAVENDVRAAALGLYAASPELPDILTYLSVGTGISTGTVVDGRLLRGTSGVAGELGQMPVVAGATAGALLTSTEKAGAGPAVEAAAALEGIERDAIFETAAGSNILRVIADVVTTIFVAYDPAILYVGGGVSRARGFHPALLEAVAALRSHPALTFDFVDLTRISPVPSGVHPGTSGAIHLARQAMEEPGRQVRPAKQEATA
jgi:predicted NBD/HSP70 family sugar kinase